jgi:hypothetical protein
MCLKLPKLAREAIQFTFTAAGDPGSSQRCKARNRMNARVNPKELPIFQQLPRFQKGPGRIANNSTYRTGELFYLFGNCSAAAKDRKDAIQICVQPFAKKEF